MRTTSPLSDTISEDLKKRGMKFVGSTMVYSYLQAIGILNAHGKECDLCACKNGDIPGVRLQKRRYSRNLIRQLQDDVWLRDGVYLRFGRILAMICGMVVLPIKSVGIYSKFYRMQ